MKSVQVRRGFSRLALVAASVLMLVAFGHAGVGLWTIANTYLVLPEVKVLVPSGHMVKVGHGLSEAEYTAVLSPYFSSSPPPPPADAELNPFAEQLRQVHAIRLDGAVRDAMWPAQRAAERRRDAIKRLVLAALWAGAAIFVYIGLRVFAWVLAGFFTE